MQRSFLAITLAVLFILSSVVVDAQQPEAYMPEEPTFRDFVKAMVLSVPAIAWRLVRSWAFGLCLPLSMCLLPLLEIVTREYSSGISGIFELCCSGAFIFFAPLISALAVMAWIPFILIFPCLTPCSVFSATLQYFIPLAFPGRMGNQIVGVYRLCGICSLSLLIPPVILITLVSLLLGLIVFPPAMLLEIIWFPIIAPILLLFAIILRAQRQGIGLLKESLETRAESLIIRICPSLEVLL